MMATGCDIISGHWCDRQWYCHFYGFLLTPVFQCQYPSPYFNVFSTLLVAT